MRDWTFKDYWLMHPFVEVPRCLTEARLASLEGDEFLGVSWLVCRRQRGELSPPGGYKPLWALRLIRGKAGRCFYHADCSALHNSLSRKTSPHTRGRSDGALLARLCWSEGQLRKCHKPSKTPKRLLTHFLSLPLKTESSPPEEAPRGLQPAWAIF